MSQPTPNQAGWAVQLAKHIVPQIEATWGCIIEVDVEVLHEAVARAQLTIEHVGMRQPNEIKQAGHYAFWLRKLKPLRIINLEQHALATMALVESGFLKGSVVAAQAIVPPCRRLYINEIFALLAAVGIARTGGYEIRLNAAVLNDLAVSLRYHSFSPSALSALLAAHIV